MRYSLLSRFQGTLLGAVLGDELGCYGQQHPERQRSHLSLWRPGMGSGQTAEAVRSPLSLKGKLAIKWANALLSAGSLSRLATQTPTTQTPKPDLLLEGNSVGELAIAALPLLLFCHDSPIKLRQSLEWIVDPSQETRFGQLLTFGYALAQLLQEQGNPHSLVSQTVYQLKQSGFSLSVQQGLTSWLVEVEQCVQQRVSLPQAIATLMPTVAAASAGGAIGLALYCFLTTPDHLVLSLLRAAQANDQAATVVALTGALTGAYNSILEIPLEWHLALLDDSQPLIWGASGVEIQTLATRLLTSWSGMYDATDEPTKLPAIAAPGVIRPR